MARKRQIRSGTSYRVGEAEFLVHGKWDATRMAGRFVEGNKPKDGPLVIIERDQLGERVRSWQKAPANT